jgi:cephalosporin hydroxylase
MSEVARFFAQVAANIEGLKADPDLRALSRIWARAVGAHKYTYNFTWMGRPIIQVPQDVMAMQELIFRVQPDAIVETGIAHGGSLVFYASMLELLGGDRFVLGVDVDIRAHNRQEIDAHPMRRRIQMIEGSSVDPVVVSRVHEAVRGRRVLVALDSNHTHDHVLAELRAYAPLVHEGSYVVVFDTLIEDLPASFSEGRPWGPGDNPKTAVRAFLGEDDRFAPDESIDAKLQISVAPGGYLRCLRD